MCSWRGFLRCFLAAEYHYRTQNPGQHVVPLSTTALQFRPAIFVVPDDLEGVAAIRCGYLAEEVTVEETRGPAMAPRLSIVRGSRSTV